MTIDLPPELAQFIEDEVAAGRATDAQAAVIDAIQSLMNIRYSDPKELAAFRREFDGISEDPDDLDPDFDVQEIREEGMRILAAKLRKAQ